MPDTRIYIGSDHNLEFTGVKNRDNQYLNDGVCTWSLKKASDLTELGSGSLSYVAASDGDYIGVIDQSVTELLEKGKVYYLDTDFDSGDVYEDRRRLRCVAYHREAS